MIAKLEKKKLEAVATERFEYAKKIKSAIGEEISRYHDIFAMSYPHRLRHTLTLQSEKVEINKHSAKTTFVRLYLFPPSSPSPSPSPPGELVEAGQMLASLQMEKRFLCQLLTNCTNQKILLFGNDKYLQAVG